MIKLAKISRPHGVRGDFKAVTFSGSQSDFSEYSVFFIAGKEFQVERIRVGGRFFIVKLQGVNSIAEVEDLRGNYLALPRNMINAPQGELIEDYLGLSVYDAKHEFVGFISNFLMGNQIFFFEIVDDKDLNSDLSLKKSNDNLLLPCQKDLFSSVDFAAKKAYLQPEVL